MSAVPSFTIVQAVTPQGLAVVGTLFRAYAASLDVDPSYQDFAAELVDLPGK